MLIELPELVAKKAAHTLAPISNFQLYLLKGQQLLYKGDLE